MVFRFLLLSSLSFTIISCSGWNSELDTAFIEDKKLEEKPYCEYEVKNNCFTQSMRLVLECLPAVTKEKELLTNDWATCKSASGKQINFIDNSLKAFVNGLSETMRFIAYNGQKKCFEFIGNSENFLLDSPEFGTVSVETLENGDTQVSCLFDDGFIVPYQAKTLGCRGQKAAAKDVAPSHNLNYTQDKDNAGGVVYDHFQFFLSGAGVQSEPLFRCIH